MSKILVTGGCGFIGSNFMRYYLENYPNDEIICLDKLSYSGNESNITDLNQNSRFRFVKGDICDPGIVGELMQEVQGVINFAAETHVDRSIDDPFVFLNTNVLGTVNLIEHAKKNDVTRFLQMSTDEVYGSIAEGVFTEESELKPNSPYSASKASADLFIRSYRVTYDYPAIIARCTNNYGPYQYPEKVIPLFISNLMDDKNVPVYGDGRNSRDWIHVEDSSAALSLIFEKGKLGEIYNIGSNHELTNLELTKRLLSVMGKGDDKIEYVADRPGHDLRYALDFSKTEALGFKPRWDIENGLQNTVEWYQKNEAWWKPLKADKYTVK